MAEKGIEVRFKLGEYFRAGSHKVVMRKGENAKQAIALPELIQETNNFSIKNRPGCAPTLLKSSPKDLFLRYNVKCNLKTSDPRGHDVKIHFDVSKVMDETTAKDLDVAVSCGCEAFLWYGGQWNAHQRDALEGEARPLLTAPTERLDLRENFVICKHIKAVSERILPSVQHNIVKILRQRDLETKKEEAPTPSRLEVKQREMRERQNKKPLDKKKREQDIRKKLEEGIAKREVDDVVKRDTPATPEEQQRVPVLPPQDIPAPDAHEQHLQEIPEIEELNDEPVKMPTPPPAPAPPPAQPTPLKPQALPRGTPQDREMQKRLMKEDQKRQQRETQNRLRNQRR